MKLLCVLTAAAGLAAPCLSTHAQVVINQTPSDLLGFARAEYSIVPTRLFRAADDLVMPTGNGGPWAIRRITAIVATNCVNFDGVLERYTDAAGAPAAAAPIFSSNTATITDLGTTVTVEARLQRIYEFSWGNGAATLFESPAAQRSWLAFGLRDTFSFIERAYVCSSRFAQPPSGQPAYAQTFAQPGVWVPANTLYGAGFGDLAFRIEAVQFCRGDFNRSGTVSIQDLFDFLAAYFANLPSADINNSGAVSTQDLFDFLASYFTPCA